MQIFVKARKTAAFAVDECSTVLQLKEYVNEFHENPNDLLISFGGKTLQDSNTLAQSGLAEGSTVYLARRMRGGRDGTSLFLDQDETFDFFGCDQKPETGRVNSEIFGFEDLLPEELALERSDSRTVVMESMDAASRMFLDEMSLAEVQMPAHAYAPPAHAASHPAVGNTTSEEDTDGEAELEVAKITLVGAKRKAVDEVPSKPQKRVARTKKAEAAAQFSAPVYMAPFQMPMGPAYFGSMPVMAPVQQNRKGVAYDLELVDERLRKRLLKNRRSAERSRQRKNEALRESEENLQQSQEENAELRTEISQLKEGKIALELQNAAMRELLQAHGIALPF